MSGWLSLQTLQSMGVRFLGKGINIKVSDICRIYKPSNLILHDNIRIDDFCVLTAKEPIEIGNYVHIAPHCLLASAKGIHMEDFSGLASGCKLYGGTDDYLGYGLTNPTVPLEYRKVTEGKIIMKQHTILGANTVVLPGITCAEGTSVAASSFLNKNTEPWGLYGGIPAKRLKDRKRDCLAYVKELQQ